MLTISNIFSRRRRLLQPHSSTLYHGQTVLLALCPNLLHKRFQVCPKEVSLLYRSKVTTAHVNGRLLDRQQSQPMPVGSMRFLWEATKSQTARVCATEDSRGHQDCVT
jgi:hypothetical protein